MVLLFISKELLLNADAAALKGKWFVLAAAASMHGVVTEVCSWLWITMGLLCSQAYKSSHYTYVAADCGARRCSSSNRRTLMVSLMATKLRRGAETNSAYQGAVSNCC